MYSDRQRQVGTLCNLSKGCVFPLSITDRHVHRFERPDNQQTWWRRQSQCRGDNTVHHCRNPLVRCSWNKVRIMWHVSRSSLFVWIVGIFGTISLQYVLMLPLLCWPPLLSMSSLPCSSTAHQSSWHYQCLTGPHQASPSYMLIIITGCWYGWVLRCNKSVPNKTCSLRPWQS